MIDFRILDVNIEVGAAISKVATAHAGAIDVFIGTVRDNTRDRAVVELQFEAYEPMALAEMRKIGLTAIERWSLLGVSIHHRVGTLKVGDIAVVIAVSAPHRDAAFEACKFCIDTLKMTVPIWKKEIFIDGEVWVAAHP
jgi:molybdopterin synthase catalytic subunit